VSRGGATRSPLRMHVAENTKSGFGFHVAHGRGDSGQ
jgi:hypothetical protein